MNESPIHFQPHPHSASEPCPGGCEDIEVMQTEVCKSKQAIEVLNRKIEEGHDQITSFETRLDEGNKRMSRIEASLANNAGKLDTNSADTTEILEIMRDGKAFFRFAHRAGEVLKWTLGVAVAVLAFWYAVKDWVKH